VSGRPTTMLHGSSTARNLAGAKSPTPFAHVPPPHRSAVARGWLMLRGNVRPTRQPTRARAVSATPCVAAAEVASTPKGAAAAHAGTRLVPGMATLLHERPGTRVVLLDQFGVLHDGRTAYPAAIEGVRQLAAQNIKTYVLSNSSRRSSGTLAKLGAMGFKEEWFAGAVTSGELAWTHVRDRPSAWWRRLGRRVLHINWAERGAISLDGLNLEVGERALTVASAAGRLRLAVALTRNRQCCSK
jgi:hypothetical protein